jgi:hypothetical protein
VVDPAVKERIQAAVKKAREDLLEKLEADEVKHQDTMKSARQELIASLKAKTDKTPQLYKLIAKLEAEEEKVEAKKAAPPASLEHLQQRAEDRRLRDTFAMNQGFNVPPAHGFLPKLKTELSSASTGPHGHHEPDSATQSDNAGWPLPAKSAPMSVIHPALRQLAADRNSDAGTDNSSATTLLNQSWPGADWSATGGSSAEDTMMARLNKAASGLYIDDHPDYSKMSSDDAWREKVRTIRIAKMAEVFGLGNPKGLGNPPGMPDISAMKKADASGGTTAANDHVHVPPAEDVVFAANDWTCQVCGVPVAKLKNPNGSAVDVRAEYSPLMAFAKATTNPFDEPGVNNLSPAPLSAAAKHALMAMGVRLPGAPDPTAAADGPARSPLPANVRIAPPQASAERPFASLYRSGRLAPTRDEQRADDETDSVRVDAAGRMRIHDELLVCLEQYWLGVRDVGSRTTVHAAMRDVLQTVEVVSMREGGFDTPEALNAFLFEEPAPGEAPEVTRRREEEKVRFAFVTAWVERAEREKW